MGDDVASYYYGSPMCQFNDQVTPTSTPAPTTTNTPTHTCDDIPCDHGNGFYPQGDCNKCFCQCHDGYQDEICCAEYASQFLMRNKKSRNFMTRNFSQEKQ